MILRTDFLSTKQPDLAALCERLSALYCRPATCSWTYAEGSLFQDLCRRQDFEIEVCLLERFAATDKFFPRSLEALLNGWNKTLDRCRMTSRKQTIKSTPPPRLKGVEQSPEALARMATALEKHRQSL